MKIGITDCQKSGRRRAETKPKNLIVLFLVSANTRILVRREMPTLLES